MFIARALFETSFWRYFFLLTFPVSQAFASDAMLKALVLRCYVRCFLCYQILPH